MRVSSILQFFISGLTLSIYITAAIITFHLIAIPMAEMVGGTSYINGFSLSDLAAGVMIALQICLGLLLMDAAGVTRLFDCICGLKRKKAPLGVLFHIGHAVHSGRCRIIYDLYS